MKKEDAYKLIGDFEKLMYGNIHPTVAGTEVIDILYKEFENTIKDIREEFQNIKNQVKVLEDKTKNEETFLVFVYGTLMQREKNHYIIADAKFQGLYTTIEKYTMDFIDYPSLFDTKGVGSYIGGEVYEVTKAKLKTLDFFEGVPNLYYRDTIEIHDGYSKTTAYVYFRTK